MLKATASPSRMLDVVDFGANPQASEFGRLGVLYVRHGKAMTGSVPKQRSVLTVFGWATECLEEWMNEIRPALARGRGQMLWPTERGGRVAETRIEDHVASIRRKLGLPAELTFHSLRRSYVTHLIADGFDARFVQEQASFAQKEAPDRALMWRERPGRVASSGGA
jgi:integrase/recombinase XerC